MSHDVERLRRELAEAFANRAHLYRLLLDTLEAELGRDRAAALLAEVLERRGREVAAVLFRDVPPEPHAIADRFLAVSPDSGRLYPHDVRHSETGVEIRVRRCPLKDSWQAADLAPERIALLCRVAGAFDRGLFEATGVAFENNTWSLERGGGCCWISLAPRD